MPQKLHIVRTNDFVRLDAHGKIDFEASRIALSGLASVIISSGCDCALLDLREVQSQFSITQLWTLANLYGEMGFQRRHRLAILHRLDGMERADFFAMCAANRGWPVASFDTFEEAFEWLSTTEELDAGPA